MYAASRRGLCFGSRSGEKATPYAPLLYPASSAEASTPYSMVTLVLVFVGVIAPTGGPAVVFCFSITKVSGSSWSKTSDGTRAGLPATAIIVVVGGGCCRGGDDEEWKRWSGGGG